MLVFYKERKLVIISIAALILDGVFVYFIPSYFNNLNWCYPMLTISFLPFLYQKNLSKYYKWCFILGIIYDLLYSHLFLYHALFFLLLGKVNSKIMKYFANNLFLYIILVIINIMFYDIINFFLIMLTNYQIVTLSDLIYKIKNSMLVNILSGFIYFFLTRKQSNYHKM